ncbi:TPR-like protein, partial [Rhizodiscina lignyota]
LPCYSVPHDQDKNFYARDYALETIKEALCSGKAEVKPSMKPQSYPLCFAVHGPGGMGKTQIAAQFVSIHRTCFDAVLWINAENASKISQAFSEFAVELGLISEGSIDARDQSFTRDIVKRWLVNPLKDLRGGSKEKASWLLVFDGVEHGELLNDFWPYNGPGSILITSRNPYSWAVSLELKPFSTDEATEYLMKITGLEKDNRTVVSDEEKASAVTIARRLGGLPLALAQMGAIIAHQSLSFTEFLRSYEERGGQQEFLEWNIDRVRPQLSNYEHNVASVWAFDSLSLGAFELLNIMSMLDPDWIPERLFDRTEDDTKETVNYKDARNELLVRSLATRNKRDKAIFIHRLVQDVTRTRMGVTELRRVFFACVRLISSRWPFEVFTWRHGVARWEECEELFPHIERLKTLFPEITPSVDSFEDYQFARLLVDAGWYRHERGESADAVLFNNMAQSICESMKLRILEYPEYVSDNGSTMSQLNFSLAEINHNRGCIALEINEPIDALKYHKLFNKGMIKELAGKSPHDDMRLAISWNELGNAHMLNKNYQMGEECFLKSIEEMKRLKNFHPILISLPIANLGLAYWLQQKYEQALAVLEEGLQERKDVFGSDDRDSFITGRFLHALGNVKGSQDNQDKAFDYHRRALQQYKSTLGNRHHRTADVFVKVAEHHIRLKQHEMALALLDHALGAYSSAPHFMPEKVRASFKRSQALRCLQRTDEANSELSKCFKLYDENRKVKETDLSDADVDELITFWSK